MSAPPLELVNELDEPFHVVLTLCPNARGDVAKTSYRAVIFSAAEFGIVWRDDRAHPDARTFTPWHRIDSMDW